MQLPTTSCAFCTMKKSRRMLLPRAIAFARCCDAIGRSVFTLSLLFALAGSDGSSGMGKLPELPGCPRGGAAGPNSEFSGQREDSAK